MEKELFVEILDKILVLYLYNFETHRFMQDNDPKHTSDDIADFLNRSCINWWRTPPESPDFNPCSGKFVAQTQRVCTQRGETEDKGQACRRNQTLLGDGYSGEVH